MSRTAPDRAPDKAVSGRAVLVGGPEDLPHRIVSVSVPPAPELKVAFRGGYEDFVLTTRREETAEGELPVYEWVERTDDL